MRVLKFRVLHCDIFCKSRMFKFKMTENENCDYCGRIETIKHLLWDCERASNVWSKINTILEQAGMADKVFFDTIFAGTYPVNEVLETIVTKTTQLLLQIDRSAGVCSIKMLSEFIFLGKMNRKPELKNTWEKLMARNISPSKIDPFKSLSKTNKCVFFCPLQFTCET